MKTFDPSQLPFPETHRILLGGVAPRPIAFVATQDNEGRVNLSPFSFFNAFGVNPPVVCFSPSFAGKTGAPKDTLLNLLETRQCTISVVTYDMVHQASLASAPYERGVDEFIKAGFTKRPSQHVGPPGVAESPFIMEARLLQHVEFGGKPGSANLMICEVLLIHVSEAVMDETGLIDPHKMDQVARMGGAWYTRANAGLFQWPQPAKPTIGVDSLPKALRESPVLSGQDLSKLASVAELPQDLDRELDDASVHERVKELLRQDSVSGAWELLKRR